MHLQLIWNVPIITVPSPNKVGFCVDNGVPVLDSASVLTLSSGTVWTVVIFTSVSVVQSVQCICLHCKVHKTQFSTVYNAGRMLLAGILYNNEHLKLIKLIKGVGN